MPPIRNFNIENWPGFLTRANTVPDAQASENLKQRYPGLRIVGRQDGYFEDSAEVVDAINASRADLLFVALGSPRQEMWISEHRQAIDAPFVMGVGGTLDVISGKAKRAPKIFQKTGTEFLFRLLTDPRRWRRYLTLLGFMLDVMNWRIGGGQAYVAAESVGNIDVEISKSLSGKKTQREYSRSFRVSPLAKK